MTVRKQVRTTRTAAKRRQFEVEQCLRAHGLARGPRKVSSAVGVADGESAIRRLRHALVSLGPVFSAFGRHLSSRIDLFSPMECLELGSIVGHAPPGLITQVREVIDRELGAFPSAIYSMFEEHPCESRLGFEVYRARLRSGEAVTVKVARSILDEQFLLDLDLLPSLGDALSGVAWIGFPLESTIAEFRTAIARQVDLTHEADAIEAAAKDSGGDTSLRLPLVYRDLSASSILTLESFSGKSLDYLFMLASANETRPGRIPSSFDIDFRHLARRLWFMWLSASLQGRSFPVDLRADRVIILPNEEIGYNGSNFAVLDSEAKSNLFEYLIAASTRDADRAWSSLVKEMTRTNTAIGEHELLHRIRQVVPFRDGGWTDRGETNSTAEHIFSHMRVASRSGYQGKPDLLNFLKGLFCLANSTRLLAPDRDVLLESLEDLRLATMLTQLREMIAVRQLSDGFDRYVATMMELPKRLDEVLTVAATGALRFKLQQAASSQHRSIRNSAAVVIALCSLLGTVALLSHQIAGSVASRAWVGRIGSIAFVLVSAHLLRAVSRVR